MISISPRLGIDLLHLDAFLPGSVSQLVLDLGLHVEGLILDLLVNVPIAVVADHVDV